MIVSCTIHYCRECLARFINLNKENQGRNNNKTCTKYTKNEKRSKSVIFDFRLIYKVCMRLQLFRNGEREKGRERTCVCVCENFVLSSLNYILFELPLIFYSFLFLFFFAYLCDFFSSSFSSSFLYAALPFSLLH